MPSAALPLQLLKVRSRSPMRITLSHIRRHGNANECAETAGFTIMQTLVDISHMRYYARSYAHINTPMYYQLRPYS